MKIIFEKDELDALPDDAREKLGDDLEIEVESLSELSETFEDVSGLKKALGRERKSARENEADLKATRKRLEDADPEVLAEKEAEIEKLKSDHAAELESRDTEITSLKEDATRGNIAAAVSKAGGNVDLLTPHLRDALATNPDLDIDGYVAGMKIEDTFAGAFKGSGHSGTGSEPQHGGDGHSRRFGGAALKSMRRSDMTERQKVDYQKQHGLDAFMDLPA